jgi:methyl-accepting chemotaxis protein
MSVILMSSLFRLRSISAKAIVLVIVLVIVSITATTVFMLSHFSKVLGTDRLKENLSAAEVIVNPRHQPFSIEDGVLRIGQRTLNGDFRSVDDVASAFGGVATIFQGDKRVATNVLKPDGSRAVGTKLAKGPVYDAVLKEGREYYGVATILNKPYVAAYKPIKDVQGNIIGILFVGFEESAFNRQFTSAVLVSVITGLVLALICAVAGGYIFHRLFAPFRPLSKIMEEARNGRYSETIPFTARKDEFGELANVILLFNKAMQEQERQRAANIELVVSSFGEALAALARRDLSCRLSRDLPPEYVVLQENLNRAIAQLEEALKDIDQRAGDIAAGSKEMNSASQEMAQRTERQAAALEQTSASLNEVTSAVSKSHQGADKARDKAAEAKTNAEHGSAVARDAVEAIRLVAQSSGQITQIITVINDIAFQTNLLALNAGVEAARAGEAGRGFAVVASEVRQLAQRCSAAAKEIKELISKSEEQVENGVKLVEDSGSAFGKIVADIGTMHDLAAAISASLGEQASSLREIDQSVSQMDQTTQQNAAMAEQSCASSNTMAGFARELAERVAAFKTSGQREKASGSARSRAA